MARVHFCFFCGTGRADREFDHRLLGLRPCCASCDPSSIARNGRDTLDRMTGTLVAAAQSTALDLCDEREVDGHLRRNDYADQEIELFSERATEAARRQIQRTASRFHPLGDLIVEGAALVVMLAGLLGLYVVFDPPLKIHRHHVEFALVTR